ncbi:MAG: hypothetical protein ABFR36_04825 [Acidobacteriota bacterium]
MKKILLIVLISVFLITSVYSEVNFKGLVQNWFSMSSQENGDESESIYGFANRRIRFAPYGTLGKKVRWGVQFAFDKFGTVSTLDAYMEYFFAREAILKFGKFAPPGTKAAALTSSGALDLIERASIVQLWGGKSGLHGYRAFGAQLSGKLMEGKLYYAFMVSNALTAGNNWLPGVKTLSTSNSHTGMGIWGRIEAYPVPGLQIGGFLGSGSEADPVLADSDIKRSSYGGNIFYKKNNINLKFEYLSGESNGVEYSGMYAVAGYRFNKFEPIFGYESFTTVLDGEKFTNLSGGINYFHSKNIKFQINYVMRQEDITDVDNDILYANFQYSFNSKKK